MKVDSKNFIAIQGWMRTELNLSGNELIAYALIYGFSQDGESAFGGSLQFVADWLGVTKDNARLLLKRLTERGIINKTEIYRNGVKFCDYSVVKTTERTLSGQCLNNEGSTETVTGVPLKQWWGSTETVPHNNIHNNTDKNIEKENTYISSFHSDISVREKQANRRFIKPTVEEVRAYISEKNYPIDAEQFWNFYEAKGWMIGKSPMKNWKSCIATWLKNGRSNSPTSEPFVSKLNNPRMDEYDTETTWDDLITSK